MTLNFVAGQQTYYLLFSEKKSGTGLSATPDGDAIGLASQGLDGAYTGQVKVTKGSRGAGYATMMGYRNIKIVFRNCSVRTAQTSTKADELAKYQEFMYKHSLKQSGTGVYLWAYTDIDSKYLPLGFDSSGTAIPYLIGYIPAWNLSYVGANRIKYSSISFEEVTNIALTT